MPKENNSLGFIDEDSEIKAPVGGDFLPSGFVGQVYAAMFWSFYSKEDSKNFDDVPVYTARRAMGDGFRYYYRDDKEVKVAMEVLNVVSKEGKKMNAQRVWSFQIGRDSVMNFADPSKLEMFSDPIVSDVNVSTLKSKKGRHEFHMLALPFAVQAMARALGYEYAPFEVPELLEQNIIYSDEFQKKMIGLENDFQDSILWQRRKNLWGSLGEENPEAQFPVGAKDIPDNLLSTSKELSRCLSILKDWKGATYARLIQIPDPRVDATYPNKNGETKRLTIPALYELFGSKADAQKAADMDIARAKKNSDSKAASNGKVADVPIPAGWKEFPEDWLTKRDELRGQYEKVPSTPVLNKLAKEIGDVTVEELKTVWN